MAAVGTAPPPRSSQQVDSAKSSTILRSKDSRKILMDMGFSRHRAEKALAATGDCGIQVAADWLLSHVFDPDLDKPTPREYIVYACPMGPLGEAIEEYMESALMHTGRNGAHKSFPHVTLCQFFKCDDALNPYVVHALNKAFDTYSSKAPQEVRLRRFTTQGYIGLFLEEDAASWFRDVMRMFSIECKNHGLGVQVEPHKRQLHITMAHQYPPEHHAKLDELAQGLVDPAMPTKWELRLYSRDIRLATSEVYKVLYPYTPRKEDELELIEDDFVFVSMSDQGQTDSEGWFFGRSFMTGFSGLYPGNYVEKAKDADCWTLHKSWTVSNADGDTDERTVSPETVGKSFVKPRASTIRREDQQLYNNSIGLLPDRKNVEELYAKVEPKKNRKSNDSPPSSTSPDSDSPPALPQGPRRLFIFRHAERVDVTFGKQWIQLSFDAEGYYHRRNLNMPKELPKRKGGPQDFMRDSPITELGLFQARLTGEGMREQGIKIHNVISSPAIRCVQTANAILQGLGDFNTKIKVEHGLFEWLAWCRGEIPKFMTAEDMGKFGLQVDPSYSPLVSVKDLKPNETHLEFYKRMYNITRLILRTLGPNSGNVMIVGHAATLEACTRQLIGGQPRNPQDLTKLVQKIPYCGVCVCQESGHGKTSTWDFIDPPVPPLTHAPNIRFDWRCLQ